MSSSRWMAASGATGFAFFLIANFTNVFTGASLLAGCLQICVNAFVFTVWARAFVESRGLKKFVAFFGVAIPAFMAGVTFWRVLLPALIT
jgi:hypothetical protein